MIEITGTAQKAAWADRRLPLVEEVRPGLRSIPVPIPNSPLRYVLVYAFETPGGLVLVDAGWDSPEAWQALTDGLASFGAQVSDVRGILVTHMHPDHFGLAPRLRTASGAWLAMHAADAALVEEGAFERRVEAGAVQLAESDAPSHLREVGRTAPWPALAPDDGPDRLLDDGDRIEAPGWDLRAIWTPGHTPGHLCFAEGNHGLLLTGDHVLPRITPGVNLLPGQLDDPLGCYLASLRKLVDRDPAEVLPAHEYRFRGLHHRVHQLLAHHEERLAEVREAVVAVPGGAGFGVAASLSWSRPFLGMSDAHQRMALRETLAHLVLLELQGTVRSVADGLVTRWYPVVA